MKDVRLIQGDCLDVLPTLEAGSVDAVCTDPPYGLEFMGKEWDRIGSSGKGSSQAPSPAMAVASVGYYKGRGMVRRPEDGKRQQAFHQQWAEQVLRVLKPGAYLLAFGGTRTFHRLTCAIEDAGFEIRDSILTLTGAPPFLAWITGQGFPKGAGCLKPAWEPIVCTRKPGPHVLPLPGLDECRVGTNGERLCLGSGRPGRNFDDDAYQWPGRVNDQHSAGRYPPNLLLTHSATCRRVGTKKVRGDVGGSRGKGRIFDGLNAQPEKTHLGYADADGLETVEAWECDPQCPVLLLGEQSGERKAGCHPGFRSGLGYHGANGTQGEKVQLTDAGTAARFFPQFAWSADDVPFLYQPKASKSERWFYCQDCADAFPPESRQEHQHGHADWSHLVGHPTQKPLALMRWLVRLITPPGGLCLDPFLGSGTTALACFEEGRRFLGIENDTENGYFQIAQARLKHREEQTRSETPLFSGLETP